MMKILISTSTFGQYDDQALKKLKDAGCDVELNPFNRKLALKESFQLYRDRVGVIAGTETITKELLESAKKLKIISRCGSGIDNVDIYTANQLGISVFNTPYGPTLAVAELTVALILCLMRRILEVDKDLRDGIWKKKMGNLLSGKNVGIIGYGRIGQKVSELLLPFGVEISYCDACDISCSLPCSPQNIESLLSWADIILLHLSTPNEPIPLIGKIELEKMKQGSWLINTSRGGIVDEEALYLVLKNGKLAGAAIDVFDKEPYEGPLRNLENVILTPHIGSYAKEARIEMEKMAVENLLEGLKEDS